MRAEISDAAWVIDTLARIFYQVVPTQYSTYCALTSRISRRVLSLLNIPAELMACQVWATKDGKNHVVGFTGTKDPNRWDGHVICVTQQYLIDAALHHFRQDFGLEVPAVITRQRILMPSQIISRIDLSNHILMQWLHPPPGAHIEVPIQSLEIIEEFAQRLVPLIRSQWQEAGKV